MFQFLVILFLYIHTADTRTFSVDYNNHIFLKDGKPFRYISGSMHYFRVHPDYWEDRMQKIRALGLNVLQTYVPWNWHETTEGNFDFSGWRNLTQYITLAQKYNLSVNLRPGPFIDAEFEFGGFPWWLLKYNNLTLHAWNPTYIEKVQNWFNVLLEVIKPLLYKNGGPILMVQVENEYGSISCDKNYTSWLRDLIWSKLGNDTTLYMTDSNNKVQCSHLPGIVSTIDFGISDNLLSIYNRFMEQDLYSGGAPHVCSEYWVIWYTSWGNYQNHTWSSIKGGIDTFKSNIEFMYYNLSASFNIYMIHGGTSFGFWNGADEPAPVTTSSDWTAAISEEGDITDTYLAIRDFISNISGWEQQPLDVPQNNSKANYGQVQMTRIGTNLISTLTQIQEPCVSSTGPLSFEEIDHGYGYVLYTTTLTTGGKSLYTPNIRDYGYVFLNNVYQGVLMRVSPTSISINANKGDILRILVENRGRNKNFEVVYDSKGLNVNGTGLRSGTNVTLDRITLQNWVQCGINLTKEAIDSLSTHFLEKSQNSSPKSEKRSKNGSSKAKAVSLPGVYVGEFTANEIQDTFFDSTGWGKGQLFINGYNLGHYWPLFGPQMTLYVPKPFLQQKNTVVLIELLGGQQTYANFIDHKIWIYSNQTTASEEYMKRKK